MKLWTLTRKLDKPLGQWLLSGDLLCQIWPAYFEYNTGHLYVKHYDKYFQYQHYKEHLNTLQDGCAFNWIPTPSSAPAQIKMTNGMVTWEHFMCWGIVGDIDVKQD
eukprot:5028420-Ditylum_brightwellii.AAC.1